MTANTSYPLQGPTSSANEPLALQFAIRAALLEVQTTCIVQVVGVHGGGLGPVGTVDVIPVVNQVDGAGNAIPHATIYGRPYSRVQGGANAVICDPEPGDIGVCVFASRDISAVLTAAQSGASNLQVPPGSLRIFDYADGMYLGGLPLGMAPTQYIQFAGGINIESSNVETSGNLSAGTGYNGTFTTPTGQTVTVQGGLIVNID